jgi:hypothetical protein
VQPHLDPLAIRLLYLGDVPIRPDQSGGSVVLWRHQQLLSSGTIRSADPGLGHRLGLGAALWSWLRRLRLGRLALILQPWLWQQDVRFSPAELATLRQQADAILTVAHGLAWLQAMAAARASGLPLITVVHDWYPDASGCPRWGLWIWERSFRQLMRRSALIFAVSDGMARQIGPHPNLQVLPPIPDPALQPCPPRQPHGGPWRLYYSGLCGGLYNPLLQQLIQAVAADPRFALHLSGPGHQDLQLPDAHGRLRCSGFLEGEVWQQAFDEADALMLVLSFERRHRRHLATHFPSKLVEYANRGRPIVIWGPPWSTAVQWGQDHPNAYTHTSACATQLMVAADRWLQHQPLGTSLISAFSSEQISTKFSQTLKDTLAPGCSSR